MGGLTYICRFGGVGEIQYRTRNAIKVEIGYSDKSAVKSIFA